MNKSFISYIFQIKFKTNENCVFRPKQTNLNEDVNDFIELIPKAEIKAKIDEYYRNDMDTQHIFEFMHSKVFQELRRSVLDMADVKEILQYLNKNGLNVKGAVRKVDNRLGISKIRPTSLSYASPQSLGKMDATFFWKEQPTHWMWNWTCSNEHNNRRTERISWRYTGTSAPRRDFHFVFRKIGQQSQVCVVCSKHRQFGFPSKIQQVMGENDYWLSLIGSDAVIQMLL